MSGNLAIFSVEPSQEYLDVSELSGVTFSSGTSYQIQIRGAATFCESDTKPTEGGTYWDRIKPFTFICKGKKLWILPARESSVNISD